MNKNTLSLTIAVLLGAFIGGMFVYLSMRPEVKATSPYSALREEITDYRFIDPLLACNPPEATTKNLMINYSSWSLVKNRQAEPLVYRYISKNTQVGAGWASMKIISTTLQACSKSC
jgi:hypothetical protein